MDTSDVVSDGLTGFLQNSLGIIIRPYETYRRLVKNTRVSELIFIGLAVAIYLGTATLVKTAAFRSYLLTRQFALLVAAAAGTFWLMSKLLYIIARLFGGQGTYQKLAICWAYTLVPTLAWFWITSVLYILIPPPRTESGMGIAFSVVYLIISATLLFWKIILAYLTLRFSMRLDLVKIIAVFTVSSLVMVPYGILMYRLGIFKVPFI